MNFRDFLRVNWPVLVAGLVVTVAAVVLYARDAAVPAREELRAEEKVQQQATQETAKVRNEVRRKKVTRTEPTGAVEVSEEVTTSNEQEASTLQSQTDSEAKVSRIIERKVRPTWRVSAMAAVDTGRPDFVRPQAAAVGASVERRIAGPLYVGAFVLVRPSQPTAPVVGVSLTLELP